LTEIVYPNKLTDRNGEQMPQIAFNVPQEVKDAVRTIAKAKGVTVSQYIHDLVADTIKREREELDTADIIRAQIRARYKRGGVTVDDLTKEYAPQFLFINGRDDINAILEG